MDPSPIEDIDLLGSKNWIKQLAPSSPATGSVNGDEVVFRSPGTLGVFLNFRGEGDVVLIFPK